MVLAPVWLSCSSLTHYLTEAYSKCGSCTSWTESEGGSLSVSPRKKRTWAIFYYLVLNGLYLYACSLWQKSSVITSREKIQSHRFNKRGTWEITPVWPEHESKKNIGKVSIQGQYSWPKAESELESRSFDNGFFAISINSCHHSTSALGLSELKLSPLDLLLIHVSRWPQMALSQEFKALTPVPIISNETSFLYAFMFSEGWISTYLQGLLKQEQLINHWKALCKCKVIQKC